MQSDHLITLIYTTWKMRILSTFYTRFSTSTKRNTYKLLPTPISPPTCNTPFDSDSEDEEQMIKLIDASNALAAIDSSHHDKEDGFMRYRRRGFLQKIRRVGDGMMRWWRVYREGWRDWWIGEEKRGRTRTRSVVVGGAV